MTRDEHRKACVEAIWVTLNDLLDDPLRLEEATAAFDALHGIARVCPIKATREMCLVCYECDLSVALEAGDLTNAPEEKAPETWWDEGQLP